MDLWQTEHTVTQQHVMVLDICKCNCFHFLKISVSETRSQRSSGKLKVVMAGEGGSWCHLSLVPTEVEVHYLPSHAHPLSTLQPSKQFASSCEQLVVVNSAS